LEQLFRPHNSMKDFFISYNRHDRAIAEWIAWILEDSGHTVVIQAWNFGAGSNFILEMQQAAAEADRTIAILSETSLKSGYVQAEWAAAFRQDPIGKLRSLIPIRVRPCELTGLWASISYIDLLKNPNAVPTGEMEVELLDEDEAMQRILNGIAMGRSKPSKKPTFPRSSANPISPSKPAFQQRQISPAKRQRLEQEQIRLQEEWSLRHDKLSALRQALAIEASAAVGFQLKQQIQAEEASMTRLDEKLEAIEQILVVGQISTDPRSSFQLDELLQEAEMSANLKKSRTGDSTEIGSIKIGSMTEKGNIYIGVQNF
jgi:TIR domain